MLSNLIVTNQKIVLIIDELNRERIAQKFMRQLLHEQGQQVDSIKSLPIGMQLKHMASYETLLNECTNNNNNGSSNAANIEEPANKTGYNVILPTLADLLSYQTPAYVFEFIHKLRRTEQVRRVFLWASPKHLQHERAPYILAACEHLAELVLRLETDTMLSLLARKPGGGVNYSRYNCNINKTQFLVMPVSGLTDASAAAASNNEDTKTAEPVSTFKIELDEDEVVARNALTLPYERTSEAAEGNIIYMPDADDDFDEEDPDEDLCI